MRRTILAIALGLSLLAAPSAAQARRPARTVTPVTMAEVVAAADRWWVGLGSIPPCPGEAVIHVQQYDPIHVGWAPPGACDVYFAPTFVTASLGYVNSHRTIVGRRAVLAGMLAVAMHERGHNLGFDHDAGIMNVNPASPGWAIRWAARRLRVRLRTPTP